jgi:MFS transporter, UMF1 family
VSVEASDSAAVQATQRERRGWYFYDWANSAFSTTVVTVFLGPYLITLAEHAAGPHGRVHFLIWNVRPGAYFSWMVSLSVIAEVCLLPLMGAVADRSSRKKQMLAAFAFLGAGATIAMFTLSGDRYQLGGILLVFANVCFGISVVVYNSFLPQISTPEQRDTVSSRGWALGYLGGALLLTLNLIVFLGHDALGLTKSEAVRWSLLSAGVWWAGFTLIPLARLRNRPVESPSDGNVLASGFRQLTDTLRHVRTLPHTLLFLVAFLLYNDGIQTVITLAAVYVEKELLLGTGVTASMILLVQFVAFAGALGMGRMAGRWGARDVVLGSLVVWTAVVGVAVLLPAKQTLPLYALAVVLGFVLGGSQALSRSLYSQMIPRSREAEFFAFYEITDRGTSWLGTAAFGVAFEISGSYRWALIVLVIFFIVGGLLLARVDVRRAIDEAGNQQPQLI